MTARYAVTNDEGAGITTIRITTLVYIYIYPGVVIEAPGERSSLKTRMEMTSRRVHANALLVGRGEENSIAGVDGDDRGNSSSPGRGSMSFKGSQR